MKNNIAFYHEDDYCQIEIIPSENYFHTLSEIEEIENKTLNSQNEGFLSVYSREISQFPTERLNINASEFIFLISKFAIKTFNKVEFGYGLSKKSKLNTLGFGFENYFMFVETSQSKIKNIWLTYNYSLHIDKYPDSLIETLVKIGSIWNFILVDWNEEIIVRLNSKIKVEEYFHLVSDNKFL